MRTKKVVHFIKNSHAYEGFVDRTKIRTLAMDARDKLVQRALNLVQRAEELYEWYKTKRSNILQHKYIKRFIDDDVQQWTDIGPDLRELLLSIRAVQNKANTKKRTIRIRQLNNDMHTYEQRLQKLRNGHEETLAKARNQLVDELLVNHNSLTLPPKLAKSPLPVEYTHVHTDGVTRTTLTQRVYVRWLDDTTATPKHRIAIGYMADSIFGATAIYNTRRLPMYVLGTVTRVPDNFTLMRVHSPFLYDPDNVHAMYTGLGLPPPVAAPVVAMSAPVLAPVAMPVPAPAPVAAPVAAMSAPAPAPVAAMPAPAPAPVAAMPATMPAPVAAMPAPVDINTFTTDLRNEFPEIRDVSRVTQFLVEYESIADNKARKRKRKHVNEGFVCEVAGIPVTSGVSENREKATQLRRWLRATRKRRKTTSKK